MKQVYVDSTDWCEEAKIDTQKLINLIEVSNNQSKFSYTDNLCEADLIIYRACGHLQILEDKSIRDITELLRLKKRKARLLVWGCLSKINPDSLKAVYYGPLIGPEEAWDFFCSYFSLPKKKINEIYANTLNRSYISKKLDNEQKSKIKKRTIKGKIFNLVDSQRGRLHARARILQNLWYIKIVIGCKNNCTYCSDKLAFNSVKSIPIKKIIKQFELGLRRGYKYFYLEGRDLGSYGYDTGSTLADLIDQMIERHPNIDYKIFLNNLSPNSLVDLYPRLERALASKKIFHLGSHIQSGSNRVLKLMGKKISLNRWVEVVKEIQKKYPKIQLATSFMVGFPSETNEDFSKTVNLMHYVLFDRISLYKYSERPNLPSLRIKNRISESIKNKRYNRIKLQITICRIKKQMRNHPFLTLYLLNLFIELVIARLNVSTEDTSPL